MARQSSSEVETSAAAPSYTHRIVDIVDRQGFAFVAPAGIDVEALLERYVTITPLTYALTDYPRLQTWRERLGTE